MIKLKREILWAGGLPHLSGLPHLPGVPLLHVNITRARLCCLKKTDFPIYIRDVETTSKGNQHQHNTDTDRNNEEQLDGNYPNQRPAVNQQINSMSSVQADSEDNTTTTARRKSRRVRSSN